MNYLKTPWTRQPQGPVEIDWSNPITRGLVAVINPASGDGSKVGSVSLSARRYGLSHAGNGSSYISKPAPSFGSAATIMHVGNIQFDNTGANTFGGIGTSGAGNQLFCFQGSTSSQNGRALIRVVNAGGISSAEIDVAGFSTTAPESVWVAVYDGSVNINVFQNGRNCVSGRANISASGAMSSMDNFTLGGINRGTDAFAQSGQVSTLGLAWNRALSTAEVQSISQNPWQIFRPIQRRIFVPVSAATGDATGTGSFYDVTLSFPTGTASGTGAVNGTGTGSLSAVSTTAPSAAATGSALATGALTTVTLTTITAAATGSSLATGSLDAIDLSTVSGSATGTTAGNAEGVGSVATIALSAPSASAVGSALATGSFSHISLSAVSGTASAATNGQATADLQTISISAPLAIAIASSVATGGIQSIGLTAPNATATGQAQTIARPSTDTSNSGWTPSTGSDLYAMIDEVSPNDADYISTNSAGSVCRLGLGAVADPGTASGQVVSYRASSSTGNGLRVELMQGGTVIATWNHASLPATDTTYQQSLSAAECDAITDYTALSVRLTSL